MTQVFISYSRRDLAFVEQLAADLQAAGLDVWYDISRLEGGDSWPEKIQLAIDASDVFIIMVSPDSIVSRWVRKEFLYASNKKMKIVPLLFKNCELPLWLLDIHFIDIQNENYERNFGEVLRSLGAMPPASAETLTVKPLSSTTIAQPQGDGFPIPRINPLPENIHGKIAFHEGKDYIIANNDGTDELVLVKASWSINSPRIAPGGKTVAFSSAYEDQQDSIYAIDRDGSNLKRLTGPSDAKRDWYASWSPDGTKLIFSRAYSVTNDIFIMNDNGNDQKNLTRQYGKKSLNLFSEFPWSPDGQRIVFSSNRDGNLNLYIMDKNGENIQRITNDVEIQDYGAVWSPNSDTIAFVSTRGENGETDIFIVNVDSAEIKPINITNSPHHDTNPVWSPDGTQILFLSEREGNRELYVMNSDGTNIQRITRTAERKDNPSWLR